MSHWNHRVVVFRYPGETEYTCEIKEVYYDDDGNIEFSTERPIEVWWNHGEDDPAELLERLRNAIAKPYLIERGGKLVEWEGE